MTSMASSLEQGGVSGRIACGQRWSGVLDLPQGAVGCCIHAKSPCVVRMARRSGELAGSGSPPVVPCVCLQVPSCRANAVLILGHCGGEVERLLYPPNSLVTA
jgi:hypothetical protein